MATEIVGGAALAPPTAIGTGEATACVNSRRSSRRRSILVGLFFVPLALMFVVLALVDEREPRRRPRLEPRELPELLHEPDLRPDALQDDADRRRGHDRLSGRRVRRRLLPGPLRLAAVGADRPPRHHRPVLDELPAARLLMAGDPGRARRAEPGPRGRSGSSTSRRCCSSTTTSGRSSSSCTCTSRSRPSSCTPPSSGSISPS